MIADTSASKRPLDLPGCRVQVVGVMQTRCGPLRMRGYIEARGQAASHYNVQTNIQISGPRSILQPAPGGRDGPGSTLMW